MNWNFKTSEHLDNITVKSLQTLLLVVWQSSANLQIGEDMKIQFVLTLMFGVLLGFTHISQIVSVLKCAQLWKSYWREREWWPWVKLVLITQWKIMLIMIFKKERSYCKFTWHLKGILQCVCIFGKLMKMASKSWRKPKFPKITEFISIVSIAIGQLVKSGLKNIQTLKLDLHQW